MQPIHTERLMIRNFRESDWKALQDLAIANGASPYAVYDHKWPTDTDEVKGMTTWFAEGDGFLAACDKASGILLGLIAFNPEEGTEGKVYNLGYVFHPKAHGQGFATESCTAVLNYAFGELGVKQIHAGTAAANTPSRHLLRRLGFEETASATTSFQKDVDGKPITFLAYSYRLTTEMWYAGETATP